MAKFIINAGHFWDTCTNKKDTGAVSGEHIEALMTIALRDAVIAKLNEINRAYLTIPDNLDISGSIIWVNKNAVEDDLLVDIHFNASKTHQARGTEAYYYREQIFAKTLTEEVSKALGTPNRGYFPDNMTVIGELSLLRKTKCRSALIEVCFIDHPLDIAALNYDKAAQGIINALVKLAPPITIEAPKLTEEQVKQVHFLLRWLEVMKAKLATKKLGSEIKNEYSLTQRANIVTFIVSSIALTGVYLTEADINGFLVVVGAIATLVSSIVSYFGRFRAGGVDWLGRRL